MNQEKQQCQNCKEFFLIDPDDFGFYEKIKLLPPTWCPPCRNRRRLAWRNERSLHKRKCDVPGHTEEIISMYAPGVGRVYDYKYWWGDEWDSMQYGRDYGLSRPFFAQLKELLNEVPLPNLSVVSSVNSDYSNWTEFNKNCYLVFAAGLNENIRYANKALECRDSQDFLQVGHTELGYEIVNCFDSYRLLFSMLSRSCTDSAFLYDCRNCNNCFGCTNLVGKSYCIFNQQYSKEEYQQKMKELDLGSFRKVEEIKKEFKNLYDRAIHRYANIVGSNNCSGNDINRSKNCHMCFDIFEDLEDSKYCITAMKSKELYDSMGSWKMNFSCENVDNNQGNNVACTITTYTSHEVRYCMSCHASSNLFGCIGLRNKEYCILNKQYTKEEFESLVPKIIASMGDQYGSFFPMELSPFAYNETIAQEYFTVTKEDALAKGYRWLDPETKNYNITKQATDLPDHIKDVDESIFNEVIGCAHAARCNEQCTTAFKIIPQELQFYQRLNLPLPRLCPNCRHYNRLAQRTPLKLWHRRCECNGAKSAKREAQNSAQHPHGGEQCSNEFETSYAPERSEMVYCEQCYQSEVM